jgi:hypothetical protein
MGIGSTGSLDKRKLNYVKDIGVLVNGFQNRWINVFDPNTGKRKYEIPLTDSKNFYPVMDSQQNLYRLASYDDHGVVQVVDKNSKVLNTLLDRKELRRFFEFEDILPWKIRTLATPEEDTVFYDLLSENRFLIFLQIPSMIYVFKNRALTDNYPVRPKNALKEREGRVKRRKNMKKTTTYKQMLKKFPNVEARTLRYRKLFREMFVNKKDRNEYFLTSYEPIDDKQNVIFAMTIGGKLNEAYFFNPTGNKKQYCIFRENRGDFFYGIGEKSIFICTR